MRTRMSGGVGGTGSIPVPTRLAWQLATTSDDGSPKHTQKRTLGTESGDPIGWPRPAFDWHGNRPK